MFRVNSTLTRLAKAFVAILAFAAISAPAGNAQSPCATMDFRVFFEWDGPNVPESGIEIIDAVRAHTRACSIERVTITSRGDGVEGRIDEAAREDGLSPAQARQVRESVNLLLQQRAANVAQLMVARGVPANRIVVQVAGLEGPVPYQRLVTVVAGSEAGGFNFRPPTADSAVGRAVREPLNRNVSGVIQFR